MTQFSKKSLSQIASLKLERGLVEVGLTPGEAQLFLVLLHTGPSTALKLSKQTSIKRSTVYYVLEGLQQKGLVSIHSKGFKRLFAAESPDRLESVLNRRRKVFDNLLPDLNSLHLGLKDSEAFIRHYSGIEGIKTIYDNLLDELKPGDFYLVISDQQKWYSLDPHYFETFIRRRATIGLKLQMILQDSPHARQNKKIEKRYNEEIKLLPTSKLLNTNMVIVPHKVIILQTVTPLLGMVIENPSIVHMNRVLFELIWESLL